MIITLYEWENEWENFPIQHQVARIYDYPCLHWYQCPLCSRKLASHRTHTECNCGCRVDYRMQLPMHTRPSWVRDQARLDEAYANAVQALQAGTAALQ